MEEDVAGTRSATMGQSYATCAECGAVFNRRAARIEPAVLTDDGHSEYSELCPDCDALDRRGEKPVIGSGEP